MTAPAEFYAEERTRLALKRPDLLREQALIDGAWVDGEKQIIVSNPATQKPLGRIPDLGARETEAAVTAAVRAGADWAGRSGKERGGVLRAWFERIRDNTEDLARLMTAEQGKPLAEARAEIAYAASFIEWFGEEAKRAYGDIIPGHLAQARIFVTKRPVGVVGAITPWNFPAAMITRKVGPALAMGSTIVLKPSELTPFTALALGVLAQEAGVPAGVLNIVTGMPQAIGDVLVGDPRVRKFSFTGSTAVGKMLAARCMESVKRVSLELGGNAPFVVFDDADLEAAVEGAIASKFRNTGQTCVCANRFLVQDGIYDAFAEKLAQRAAGLKVGDGLAGETAQGPLINARAVEKVRGHVEDAVSRGGRLLTGGALSPLGGTFYEPTVIVNVARDARLQNEETFGPVAGLTRFVTEAEAVTLANASDAGLASYLYTCDLDRAMRVSEALEFGMVGLNTGLISTEVAPFGGCKQSGFGREGSHFGADEFVELKTTVLALSRR